MFYFYVLFSASLNRYYVGSTGDELTERIRRHNTNHKGYTGKASDWVVKYTEVFYTHSEALKREREVKRWKSRYAIERMISNSQSNSDGPEFLSDSTSEQEIRGSTKNSGN